VDDPETRAPAAAEQEHAQAATAGPAGDSSCFALGALDVSPDGGLPAYSVDYTGGEQFALRILDLGSGRLLPGEISEAHYGSAWSRDGSMLFYLRTDESGRPFQVWRHTVGTAVDDDALVLAASSSIMATCF
jgi:oligopeptidase B